MGANASRHRVGDNLAQAGVWAARQILVNEGAMSGGRRHAVKTNTGYARYIGRVGALAVSLGVGMAVATSPGVAYADTESDADSPAASGPSGASPAASSAPTSSTSTEPSSDSTDVDESPGSPSASESAADDGGGVPKMNVTSSGGAHTSTYGTSGTRDTDAVDTTVAGEPETAVDAETVPEDETPGVVEEPVAEVPEPVDEVLADSSGPVDAPVDSAESDDANHDSGPSTRLSVEPAGGPSEGAQADPGPSLPQTQTHSATDDPAPSSASTLQATSFNTLIVPSPSADPLSALLAVPGAIVNVFTGFVGALLTPFLVPGPFAPAPLPGLWAVLAWVRREINHTFFNRSPIAVPIQTGQSLTGVVTGNLNAVDPNGDPLTATVTQQGQFGTVVINANGTYTYTPNGAVPAGGIVDSFKVTITDGPDMHLPGIFGLVQGVFECIARFVGIAQPDTIVKTIPVTVVGSAIGLPPVIVTSPVGPIVTPNSPPVVLDSSLVVTDVDSPKLSSATVKVGVGYVQGDVLGYTPTAGSPITATWNATTGVLTLSGEATLAQYQEALRSVTFASAAATVVGAKAILISATDTKNLTSLPALVAVTMLGANVPPLVVTVPVGPIVTAGSPPVALNPLLTVVDLNSPKLIDATVTITTGFTAGDVLALGPLTNNPVTGSWNAATGTLTLTGEATVAQYQEALRAVTFASTTAAVIGLRTVTIVATDDQSLASLPGLVAVTVLGLPGSAPSVIATVPVKLYTSGGTPVVLDANLTIVDVDSTSATGATVSFDPLTYDPAKDRLNFNGVGSITGVFNASSGVLTLTGAGSIADYQEALRSVTIASDAAVGLRTVSVVVTADGVASVPGLIAVTIASLPVSTNLPSVIATVPVKLYTSGGTPVVLNANLTIVDADSTSASGAIVTIGGFTAGVDSLAYNGSGPITGAFNAATGVLTLSGNATIAEYQAALRSVTFASTAGIGLKPVTIVLTADGVASAPGLVAVTVATLPVSTNLPSVIATTPVKLYTSGGTPAVLDGNLTIVDADSTSASGATVTIGNYVSITDGLAFNNTGSISGTFDPATGVLTLTGTASIAEYQAALRSVTFSSTAGVGLKPVTIVLTADGAASVPGLVTVTVASLPIPSSAPSVIATTPVKLYTSGGTPVVLDATLTIVDVDSTSATGATVTIGGYTNGVDTLGYNGSGSISGTFDPATGVLTLTGTASIAEYQAALRSVTFASTAGVGVKPVTIVLTADGAASVPGLVTVTVASLPLPSSAPSVIATTPVKLYTSGGTPVVLDGTLTIVDVDSTSASGATVTIGGYTNGVDSLGYNGSGPISGTFDPVTGVLTLTGTASIAEYQAALRSVTFASTAGVGVKPVTIVLTADGAASVPGLVTVTVASLPLLSSAPSVIATTPVKLYTSGGTPVVLDGTLTIVDVDSTSASGATVTIGGYTNGVDSLGYNGSGTISGTFDPATGILTLSGTASIAEYQAALRSVTFASTAGVGVKPVTIVLTADGAASVPGLVTVTVASLPIPSSAPSVIATTPVKLYTSGGTPVVLDATLTIVDVDSTSATGATVTIGGYTNGADTLGYNGSGTISGTFDPATGILTLSGTASIAEYQAALRSVTFASTAGVGLKPVTIVLTADGAASAPGLVTVTVASLPIPSSAPSVIATTPVKLYTSGGTPVVLDATLTIVDVDSTSASGATVTIGGYTNGVDTLGYNGSGTIGGTFDPATGVLTLTGNATIELYQAALRSVTFASTAGVGVKPVTIVLTADQVASAPGLVTVTVATLPVSTNLPSVIATTPVKLYTSGGTPVVLDATLTIVDADSTSASGATVTIGGYTNGVDSLAYNGSGPISGQFDPATGILTLSGTASIEQYQAALRSVTFASTAGVGVKPVTIVLTADQVASAPGMVTVTVATLPVSTNLPSVIATTPVKLYTSGGTPVVLDGTLTIVDIDSTSASGASVTIGGYIAGADTLSYHGSGIISGTFDAATGILALSGTASIAEYQAALRSVTFSSTAGVGVKPVTIVLTADGAASAPGLVTVTVATLPVSTNLPSVVATSPVKLYTSGGTPMVLDANVTIVDVDSTSASGATVTISGYTNGADALIYNGSGSISGTFDPASGVLTLTGNATIEQYQAALRSVTFASTAGVGVKPVTIVLTADGVPSAPGLVTVTVATLPVSTNLPSVIATTPVKLYTSGGTPVVLDATVTIVDADSTSASGATVTIGGYINGADTLGYNGSGLINGTFDAATGVLTLTGDATIEQYQAALRSVTFSSTAGVGVKPVTIVLTADGVPSAAGLVTVTVATLPVSTNLPSVIATTPVKLYTSGGTPVVLDANLMIVDVDSTSASGATVTIGGHTPGVDSLSYTGSGLISGTFDAATGVLTLTGDATIEQYQSALRSVTFSSTAGVGVKPVTVVLTADGVPSAAGLVTVTVATLPVSTNLPSVIATTPVKLYTSGGTPAVLDANLMIVDVDSTSASGATVTIGGHTPGVDSLSYTGSGLISGTFDAATGVLTLTGTASIAEYQAALRSVTFASTAGVGVKPVTIVLTADQVASAPGMVTVTVATLPVSTNLPSVIATTPVKLYTSGGTPVVLDASVTIVDADSTVATKATLSFDLLAYDSVRDRLSFVDTDNISGVWDANTGVLTLTGTASIAEYQAALRSVTFSSTAGVGVKPVTIVLTADGVPSATGLVTVTVATLPVSTNLPSVIATTPVKLYTSGGTPVVLDATVTIVDADSTSASGATVTIGGHTAGVDSLSYNGSGLINGTFDPTTGMLALTGTASIAEYQAALRSVTFASTAGVGVKPVTIVLTADQVASAPGMVTVTVATLPVSTNLPSVIATTPVKLYTSGGTPVILDATLTIVDADSTSASGATVTIGGHTAGVDSLSYNGSGLINGTFDPTTGVLALTGTASIAEYQAALRSVTFSSTAGVGVKPVTIVLTADGVPSATGLVTVTVATLPVSTNVPSVVATSAVKLYTAGGAAVVLDPVLTVVDLDSDTVTQATVTIGGVGFDSGTDSLGFVNGNGITGSWDAASGTLTLTGDASVAAYQAALRSVTFSSTAAALAGVRSVSVVVTADDVASLPGVIGVTVVALPPIVNVPPLVVTSLAQSYTAGSTAVALDPSLSVADLTSPTMSGATVTIGLGRNVNDVLAYTGKTPGISASWNAATGTLTLTGDASAQAYQEALRSVTFSSSTAATQGIRTVAIVVTDSQLASSIPAVVAVTVLANQSPIIVGSLVNAVPSTVGNAPVVLDQFVTILDDSTSIQGAKVRITLGKQTGDALSFTAPSASGITMSYDSANGVLTLSGAATVEQYQAALRSVTFSTSASGLIGLRTFTFEVTDQQGLAGTSLPFTAIVTANSAPLVTSSLVGVDIKVLNNDPAKTLDPNITILDDSTSLTGATVTITYAGVNLGGSDVLAATPPTGSGIAWSYNSTNRTLTMLGEATVAEYQAALRSVTFDTSGGLLNVAVRTVTFNVTDRQGATSLGLPLTVPVLNIL